MLLRQGVKAALPDTQKQTQGGYQNEETKKHGPNERIDKTQEEELNEMEIGNLSDASSKHWLSGCSKNSLSMATT